MKENFVLEQENYERTQEQYEEGLLFISDLHQADYLVQLAKNEYLNAVYNYLQLKIGEYVEELLFTIRKMFLFWYVKCRFKGVNTRKRIALERPTQIHYYFSKY